VRTVAVTAPSVSETVEPRQQRNAVLVSDSGISRQERRSRLALCVGEPFNPFNLFDGAMVPAEVLRSPDLLPSEKLVFARLMQFAGGKGRAWPSVVRIAEEVALSVPQTRRCISALESKGLIRRVARSGRSNEFEFLWHEVYEQAQRKPQSSATAPPHSPMSRVPQSSTLALPRSSMIGAPHSSVIAPPLSPVIGPGRSSVIARRESIESSSSEEIQIEKNQSGKAGEQRSLRNPLDDDFLHRREELEDPEQEFLLRLEERHGGSVDRHAILQCVIGDLKSYSDLKPFLDFERKQTTASHKLKNPAGHYRRTVSKFYEARAKKRDWDIREQMWALEAKISAADAEAKQARACSVARCNGTGECWDEAGLVSACACEVGQKLPPKVLAAFEQMNQLLRMQSGGQQ
jgi:hypothetical protein